MYIAEQGGWTDPRFALKVYAKAAKRRERLSGAYLDAFDRALHWAEVGRIAEPEIPEPVEEPTSTEARNRPFPSARLAHPGRLAQ